MVDEKYMIRRRAKRIHYDERCGTYRVSYGQAVSYSDDDSSYDEEDDTTWH